MPNSNTDDQATRDDGSAGDTAMSDQPQGMTPARPDDVSGSDGVTRGQQADRDGGSSGDGEVTANIDSETAIALNLQSDSQWTDEQPEWDQSDFEAAINLGLNVDVSLGLSANTSTSDDGGFDMGG